MTCAYERRSGAAAWPVLLVGLAIVLAVPLGLVAFVVAGAATVLSTPDGGASAFPAPGDVGAWRSPLPAGSYRLVSGFRTPDRPGHDGVDLAAATGTPIYAVAAGVVLDAGCTSAYCDRPGNPDLPGCGLRINVAHSGGIATRYCHAVRLNVDEGDRVVAGQLIAWVGSTGHSSGPHLHLEVHHGAPPLTAANAVDPLPFLTGAASSRPNPLEVLSRSFGSSSICRRICRVRS